MLSPDYFCLTRPDQINAAFPSHTAAFFQLQHSEAQDPPHSYLTTELMTLKYNILWTFFIQIHLKVPAMCITDNGKEDDTQLTGKL